jgi:hypothetical protein
MYSLDRKARLADQFGRTTGCEETDIVLDETLGQVQQPGLIVDGENGCGTECMSVDNDGDLNGV